MVYFSLFPDQLSKALFTLIPCIIFKSANFAFLATDVNQANKITIQSSQTWKVKRYRPPKWHKKTEEDHTAITTFYGK